MGSCCAGSTSRIPPDGRAEGISPWGPSAVGFLGKKTLLNLRTVEKGLATFISVLLDVRGMRERLRFLV